MPFARLASTIRLAAVASLVAALTLTCWAQEPPAAPTPQNTPEARPVPASELFPAGVAFPESRLDLTQRGMWRRPILPTRRVSTSLMHDGKLYLSLNDAIALALENNLDIAIARYNLNIADTDVLRAKAGAQILGVTSRHRAKHARGWRGWRSARRSVPARVAPRSARAAQALAPVVSSVRPPADCSVRLLPASIRC